MSKTIYPLLLSLVLFSCKDETTVTHREGQADVYNHAGDDIEMNTARAKARETLPGFYKLISTNDSVRSTAAIKLKFKYIHDGEEGGEHIWLYDLHFVHDSLFGIVGNEPLYTTEVKLNQEIYIDTNNTSDWFYISNGKMVGGYTLRVDYHKMSNTDKKKLEASMGCKIE